MNVLSLPDEMLASVFKYKNSENLTELRKVSSKIDSVARRYGLHKWKIDTLQINYCHRDVTVWVQDTLDRLEDTQHPSTDLLEILKYYFSKTRGVKDLKIFKLKYEQNASISNEVGEFLLENDCKNVGKLTLSGWDISINFNTMRRIMTKLKLKELEIRALFTEFEFSDAVIEGIPFERLVLRNEMGDCMKLSLPYLARLCALKIPRYLVCEIYNSTVTDLLEYLKLWTKDTLNSVEYWSIVVSKGMMSVDEIAQNLSQLKCFEDCKITKWDEVRPDTLTYSIEIGKFSSDYFNTQSIMIKTNL